MVPECPSVMAILGGRALTFPFPHNPSTFPSPIQISTPSSSTSSGFSLSATSQPSPRPSLPQSSLPHLSLPQLSLQLPAQLQEALHALLCQRQLEVPSGTVCL
ncbi:unnamed protein product [Closterium sp. NIES-53]